MFVPHTPEGTLARMLQEVDDLFRKGTDLKRIKMVERGGTTLKNILSRSNPWARDGCERQDCLPCRGERGKGGNCQQEGVVYRISCQECSKRMIRSEYTGETSRTGYLRGREHLDGLDKKKEDNPLWKHCAVVHNGEKVSFKMKIVRSHKTPLTRQIHEAVEINYSSAANVMNSKGEWNGAKIPRVVIEVGKDIQEDEEDEQQGVININKRREALQEVDQNDRTGWETKNMKKRKRGEEEEEILTSKKIREDVPEVTTVANPVQEIQNYDKKSDKETSKGGQAETIRRKTKQQKVSKCGTARASLQESVGHQEPESPRKDFECGQAQPGAEHGNEGGDADHSIPGSDRIELVGITPGLAKSRIKGYKKEQTLERSECGSTQPTKARKMRPKLTKTEQAQPRLYNCRGWQNNDYLKSSQNGRDKIQDQCDKSTKTSECDPVKLSYGDAECGTAWASCPIEDAWLSLAGEIHDVCEGVVEILLGEVASTLDE